MWEKEHDQGVHKGYSISKLPFQVALTCSIVWDHSAVTMAGRGGRGSALLKALEKPARTPGSTLAAPSSAEVVPGAAGDQKVWIHPNCSKLFKLKVLV